MVFEVDVVAEVVAGEGAATTVAEVPVCYM